MRQKILWFALFAGLTSCSQIPDAGHPAEKVVNTPTPFVFGGSPNDRAFRITGRSENVFSPEGIIREKGKPVKIEFMFQNGLDSDVFLWYDKEDGAMIHYNFEYQDKNGYGGFGGGAIVASGKHPAFDHYLHIPGRKETGPVGFRDDSVVFYTTNTELPSEDVVSSEFEIDFNIDLFVRDTGERIQKTFTKKVIVHYK